MNKKTVKLIIEILEREKRRFACEAHIEEQFSVDNPAHKVALKHYQEIEAAIKELVISFQIVNKIDD